jgi:hypothetical protein
MLSRKWIIGLCSLVIVVSFSSWGFLVHKTVNQIAIYNLPEPLRSFMFNHKQYLVYNAPRPDIRRNTDKTEATKHFIDLEKFGTNAANEMPMDWISAVKKYSEDSLKEYGWGPYNAIMQLDLLTKAFKSGNQDSILFYAADLGHYIGDLHVPLHTTVNYDGQLTGQKGLHALWESTIPELVLDQYQLHNNHQAQYLKNPAAALWVDIRKAANLVPAMLAIEKELTINFTPETKYRSQVRYGKEVKAYTKEFAEAYSKALAGTVNQQLIASANMITDFWYTAWVNAGKPNLPAFRGEAEGNLDQELKAFQKNKLIQEGLLISKKQKSEE